MPEYKPGLIPTRSRLPAILIAAGVLVAAAVAVFYFNPRETAELTITNAQIYTSHIETKGMKGHTNVIGVAPQIDNDLYVILQVKITDKLRLPLFIKDETMVLTAPDHSVLEASAIQKNEFANLSTTFPDLKKLTSAPLYRDTQIAPGQTAEGMILFHFPGATEDNWKSREAATLTLDLFHQSPQTVTIPRP